LVEELVSHVTGVYSVSYASDREVTLIVFTTTQSHVARAIDVNVEAEHIPHVVMGCSQSPTEMNEIWGGEYILPPWEFRHGQQ
jgi:hypothetical protein